MATLPQRGTIRQEGDRAKQLPGKLPNGVPALRKTALHGRPQAMATREKNSLKPSIGVLSAGPTDGSVWSVSDSDQAKRLPRCEKITNGNCGRSASPRAHQSNLAVVRRTELVEGAATGSIESAVSPRSGTRPTRTFTPRPRSRPFGHLAPVRGIPTRVDPESGCANAA